MNGLTKVAVALVLSCLAGLAAATPILSGSILNNGQVVSLTDMVTFTVRIENSGDTAFDKPWSIGSGAFATPLNNYDNFDFPTAGYPAFDISPLAAGDVFDFDFFTFIPNVGGVAPGAYVGASGFSMEFDDQTTVQFGTARWTAEGESVPEPATLALLGLGLAGIGVARRRKSTS